MIQTSVNRKQSEQFDHLVQVTKLFKSAMQSVLLLENQELTYPYFYPRSFMGDILKDIFFYPKVKIVGWLFWGWLFGIWFGLVIGVLFSSFTLLLQYQ